MAASQIPPVAFVVFGVAWLATLGLFGCIYLITRRLGISWQRTALSAHLSADDVKRIGRLIYAGQDRLRAENVIAPVWGVRILWLTLLASILSFAAILYSVEVA